MKVFIHPNQSYKTNPVTNYQHQDRQNGKGYSNITEWDFRLLQISMWLALLKKKKNKERLHLQKTFYTFLVRWPFLWSSQCSGATVTRKIFTSDPCTPPPTKHCGALTPLLCPVVTRGGGWEHRGGGPGIWDHLDVLNVKILQVVVDWKDGWWDKWLGKVFFCMWCAF